ncbi:PhoD-like phosphatase [Seminavis robusta]|uniref:PhoD-like phosphatase n=1 Tax=Seminavis robusta TaxID=568900 RepID=A0A9N8HQT6_9STRA|nr:PhoD-like phosphatase [Seminavis robusta]|eukprot:Sro1324_g262810.1 PhoD-like phosphatase (478) ;mRNA; r:22622-24055
MAKDQLVFDKVHGPLFGEVTETSVVVWYRDELGVQFPPVLTVWKDDDDPEDDTTKIKLKLHPMDPNADFTSKTTLTGLTPATLYVYEIGDRYGSFKTSGSKSVHFVFGSCIGGQGYGRYTPEHPDGPGFPIFKAMAKLEPDFIQIQGDFIYADNPIHKVSPVPFFQGQTFQTPNNVDVLEVATDLESFRARYKYNLEDEALGDFLRNTVVFNTWDDHEIFDDFGQDRLKSQGKEDLYQHGERVFHEYWPFEGPPEEPKRIYRKAKFGIHAELFVLDTRSYRALHEEHDPGVTPTMKHILGPEQKQWLLDALRDSTTTWKFICTSVPLAYPTGWPRPAETGYDGWSDGSDVSMGGPELELQEVLYFIQQNQIHNVMFISGDVHFPFAISYDPFEQGTPLFYEIGSTPFHALCLPVPEKGPDKSFNPTTLYADGKFADQSFLNFGQVKIDETGELEFHLRNVHGDSMYELKLTPKGVCQ